MQVERVASSRSASASLRRVRLRHHIVPIAASGSKGRKPREMENKGATSRPDAKEMCKGFHNLSFCDMQNSEFLPFRATGMAKRSR